MGVIALTLCILGALNCYMCPPTGANIITDANIECLALGWEISCSPEQDRCYSKSYLSTTQVEKGCTRSEQCIGRTSCCQSQYCNGDPLTSLTGYGQPCIDLSNCIQGADVMRCDFEVPNDVTKRCLCTENSYQRGATCMKKSYPDEPCTMTSQCLARNTTCMSGLCRCDPGMYSNTSTCELQVGLGRFCSVNKQCSGAYTQCDGEKCACAYGYNVINGTDTCSGSPAQRPQLMTVCAVVLITAVLVLVTYSSAFICNIYG